jgi:hypothetical protein
METKLEKVNETHLSMLNSWAESFSLPPMPSSFLPKNGFLVYVDNIPVMAGFLYLTDSSIAFLENFISNPVSNKDQRRLAISKMLEASVLYAKEKSYTALYARSSLPSLLSTLEDSGFQEVTTNCSLMIRRI